jgi:hypothetical protein
MNNEGPTPLNYATPVKPMNWRWGWWKRLGVTALIAVVHLGSGFLMGIYWKGVNLFVVVILFPGVLLVSWLDQGRWMHYSWWMFVAGGESLLVGTILAALFEGISRYRHRPKV